MAKDYRERICWIRRMASTILPSEEEKRGLYSLANNVSFDDRVNHFAELYRSMNLISTLPEYTKLRNV